MEPSDDILIEIFKKIGSKENARVVRIFYTFYVRSLTGHLVPASRLVIGGENGEKTHNHLI